MNTASLGGSVVALVVRGGSGGFRTSNAVGYVFAAVVVVAGLVALYLIRRRHRPSADGRVNGFERIAPRFASHVDGYTVHVTDTATEYADGERTASVALGADDLVRVGLVPDNATIESWTSPGLQQPTDEERRLVLKRMNDGISALRRLP